MGDQVTAYDPTTGKASVQTVQHTYINQDTNLLAVTLRTVASTSAPQAAASGSSKQHDAAVAAHGAHAPPTVSAPTIRDETIQTTTNHPWLTADHGWILASFLREGEPVRRVDGATAIVVAVRAEPGAAAMWDLTVSNVHTFAVGNGAYVVHNCTGDSAKVDFSDKGQIQSKYKHAKDFGVTENWSEKTGGKAFRDAMVDHFEDPETIEMPGTYRGKPATHFYNPRTDLNVIADGAGRFWSAWKLDDEEVWNVVMRHSLR